jgi:hypothetical protein
MVDSFAVEDHAEKTDRQIAKGYGQSPWATAAMRSSPDVRQHITQSPQLTGGLADHLSKSSKNRSEHNWKRYSSDDLPTIVDSQRRSARCAWNIKRGEGEIKSSHRSDCPDHNALQRSACVLNRVSTSSRYVWRRSWRHLHNTNFA